jgi:hypothetical protein
METEGWVCTEKREKVAPARVFSFDLKFTGTRKTLFYRRLFGYSSSTKHDKRDGFTKVYTHTAQGLLGTIPHIKMGKSVIAVPSAAAARLETFFSDPRWQPLELHIFGAILPTELRARAMDEAFTSPLVVGRERVGLATELDELLTAAKQGKLSPELAERARHVLRAAEELATLDWTDGQEFSRKLEPYITRLRRAI